MSRPPTSQEQTNLSEQTVSRGAPQAVTDRRSAVEHLLGPIERGVTAVPETQARLLAQVYGIGVPASVFVPVSEISTADLSDVSPPYVVKVVSPDLIHKSDFGGVHVGLDSEAEARAAMDSIRAALQPKDIRVSGFLVDEFVPADYEVLLGGRVDGAFGPLLMVGLGGTMVEILDDVEVRLCPVTSDDVVDMLNQLRAQRFLKGVRGRPPLNIDLFVDAALCLGGSRGLLTECSDLFAEIDLNPLRVNGERAVAVDVRTMLA